ncbi:MAG: tRNA (N(6)-L-threonylcarbamoyladenosine(37)-C(2))-methylthiotransferase MtaB [Clostridia bacterium]|nr:tRNA (N(6)-L-threonylcarbamoyladenosine(37)-C(2))-methylthiotransferase MtaB [Clostridia bacterium]
MPLNNRTVNDFHKHKGVRTAAILTLGCKVNQYESEALAEELRRLGIEVLTPDDVCDCYVINTCSVTAEADRKSRQAIRKLRRKNPEALVIAAGCVAQREPEALSAIPGVDYVIGNEAKVRDAVAAVMAGRPGDGLPVVLSRDLSSAPFERIATSAFPRTRRYIKIEDGCENRCAYCAIPDARGSIRSKPREDIVSEVRAHIEAGCREIVLTGIETASYGKDTGDDLVSLLSALDSVCPEGSCRFRLSSLSPLLFTPGFIRGITGIKSLAHHFHISVQSGSDAVLRRMRRGYGRDDVYGAIERLRSVFPDMMFTTDIIAGFPGETEEDFADTVRLICDNRFLMTHIFPYSEREGTPAARMEGRLSEEVKRERASILAFEAGRTSRRLLADYVSRRPGEVLLVESAEDGMLTGHTGNFISVRLPDPGSGIKRGDFIGVRLTGAEGSGRICSAVPDEEQTIARQIQ